MEKYRIISFSGCLTTDQASEIKEALKHYKIYKEYFSNDSYTIILKLKKKYRDLIFKINKNDISLTVEKPNR